MSLVTLKDIARELGLSDMAVSNALRGRGRLSKETRARVQETANRLGYRPNASARSMSRGRFGCVSLLLSTENMFCYLPSQLLDGIESGLSAKEYHLMVARLPDEKLTNEGYLPKILREWSSDGLLINYQLNVPERMVQLISDYRIPAIWLNSKGLTDCVYIDEINAGRIATQHLLGLGHRRIAYVDFSHRVEDLYEHYSAGDRRRGFELAMAEAGLQPQFLMRQPPANVEFDRVSVGAAFLSQPDRPTAIVCYAANNIATSMMLAAARLQLQVPKDLSVIAIDDTLVSLGLPISSVKLPMAQLGSVAAAMLLEKITELPIRRYPSRAVEAALAPGGFTVARHP